VGGSQGRSGRVRKFRHHRDSIPLPFSRYPSRKLMVPSVIARTVGGFGANCCYEARIVYCLIFQSRIIAARDNEPPLLAV